MAKWVTREVAVIEGVEEAMKDPAALNRLTEVEVGMGDTEVSKVVPPRLETVTG